MNQDQKNISYTCIIIISISRPFLTLLTPDYSRIYIIVNKQRKQIDIKDSEQLAHHN